MTVASASREPDESRAMRSARASGLASPDKAAHRTPAPTKASETISACLTDAQNISAGTPDGTRAVNDAARSPTTAGRARAASRSAGDQVPAPEPHARQFGHGWRVDVRRDKEPARGELGRSRPFDDHVERQRETPAIPAHGRPGETDPPCNGPAIDQGLPSGRWSVMCLVEKQPVRVRDVAPRDGLDGCGFDQSLGVGMRPRRDNTRRGAELDEPVPDLRHDLPAMRDDVDPSAGCGDPAADVGDDGRLAELAVRQQRSRKE